MTDYTDRETVKAAVGRTTSLHEADYDRIITAVSRAIDAYCLREEDGFVAPASASARLFAGSGGNLQRIDEAAAGPLPMQACTSLVWTTNPLALAKLFRERCDESADREFQRFAKKWRDIAIAAWPNLFQGAV
mgnify:CR=1 FL=1